MPPRYSTSTSTAYPKGSPARTTVKKSYNQNLPFGFTRSGYDTTINGVPSGSNRTITSSGGGSGGGMLGPLLIIGGVFMLWIVFRGKSGAMWDAITGDNSFSANLDAIANAYPISQNKSSSSSSSGNSSAPTTGNQPDSGTHMGIDSNGNIITINSSYGNMTDAQKDAANNYAHQIGNVG